ncbi:diguanylate phosphodiesterase [Erwinia sp. S38]|uniref:diguanylate phosphodiesterase n=1 Tax=Erwinia sp. S38 TaxID=2769338 RepID=UPI00190A0CBA|nr:diguanylate phosphodiesterase [Erwinia sp. S38]MBK0004252.1 diguanylate phosphodiesterase [Erwinia sp. S38]
MLNTIIYRSHINDDTPLNILPEMVARANVQNAQLNVTGILLFNGTHFFQILEGPEAGVDEIYSRICNDKRHHNIVELMRDFSPSRRFGKHGMELFDLRQHNTDTLLQEVLDRGTTKYRLTYDDRGLQFLRTFVESRERENYFEVLPADYWDFVAEEMPHSHHQPGGSEGITFRAIIDPLGRTVTGIEAVPNSDSKEQDDFTRHLYNLKSVKKALRSAGMSCPSGMPLYVSILPMTLVIFEDSVSQLVDCIYQSGLVPEQVLLGVSEKEVISNLAQFSLSVKLLKQAGISLSIDNFGEGSAGLSLLAYVQPDRIRVGEKMIRDIHSSGPKQAILQSVIRCCSALEIKVIVSGIEKAEEWMWLEAAGVTNFQGRLFLKDGSILAWPEVKENV